MCISFLVVVAVLLEILLIHRSLEIMLLDLTIDFHTRVNDKSIYHEDQTLENNNNNNNKIVQI